jgi:hypothetical protein
MNRRSASGAARASVSCPSPPPQPFTYGEVLRRALAWVLRPDIFENLPHTAIPVGRRCNSCRSPCCGSGPIKRV